MGKGRVIRGFWEKVVQAMAASEEMRVEEVQKGLGKKIDLEEKTDVEKRGGLQQMGW